MHALRRLGALAFLSALLLAPHHARAQAGTSGLVTGSVTDASGAVIPGATVNIHNALSGYDRTTPADAGGNFQFSNLPFGSYTLTVKQKGFQSAAQVVSVQSPVAISKTITLAVATATQTVTVTSS
ncbi:MAG: carboxypeptidase-like regulatory domain-containing protein, partial [Silvibacterium sp.]